MRVACLYFKEKTEVVKLAEYFLRLSPQICLRQEEALFVEVGKCHKLYSEKSFLMRAQVLMRRLRYEGSLAIADNISQSFIKAKYGTLELSELPLEALYDFTDPFSTDHAAREQIALMLESMGKLGITHLGQFAALPTSTLPARFGKAALLCKLRLTNELLVPWREWQPPEVIIESVSLLEHDYTGGLEPLLFELKTLLDRLLSRLWSRGLKLANLLLTIRLEKISTLLKAEREFTFDFISPQSTTLGTLGIIKVRLEKDFAKNPLRSLVGAIELKVTGHVPGFLSQRNIFHNREELNESLSALLNQLSETHGQENIFYAKPVEDRLPEKSWVKVSGASALDLNLEGLMPDRPTYLIKPEKIDVTRERLLLRQKSFRVKSWSPYTELISSHWLEEKIDRSYYQVEIHDGPTLWVYQDLAKDYFLHGYYG